MICVVDGCDETVRCSGYCARHYSRWLRSGHPTDLPLPTIESLPNETWRDVPGWEGVYRVSDLGRVASVMPRKGARGGIMRPAASSSGRLAVLLTREGRPRAFLVHRLVLLAFVGPPMGGMVGRHLNGDYTDNRLDNLSWGTTSENSYDAVLHGTHPMARKAECINGHPFDAISSKGRRLCRTCRRESSRRYRLTNRLKSTNA